MPESPAGLFRGLFETHLHVADLEIAMKFYGEVLGLELGHVEAARRVAFYWVGRNRSTMLGLWEHPPWTTDATRASIAPQHLAFEVSFDDLQAAIDQIRQQRIELRNFFDEITAEPSVFGWMPAASIYFNDVDGHLLEFIARLDGEPAPEIGVVSLAEWSRLKRR